MTTEQPGTVLVGERPQGCDRFVARLITPADADALVRFHSGLSRPSLGLRCFSLHRALQPSEVAHLTCVDGVDRVALVVEHEGEIVAVGRYDRLANRTAAEVAFVVADEFQHHGIGTMLLQQLALRALHVGITRLKASMPADNTAMISLFYSAGYPVSESNDGDMVELTLWIEPEPFMEPLPDPQPGGGE